MISSLKLFVKNISLNKKQLLLGVVGVVCLTLLIIATVMVKKHQQQQAWNRMFLQAEEQAIAGEQFDDWVVYNNQEKQYSIAIPKDWLIDEQKDENNSPTGKVSFQSQADTNQVFKTMYVRVGIPTPDLDSQEVFQKVEKMPVKRELHKTQFFKLGATKIKSGQTVLVMEKYLPDETFSLFSWFQHNNKNYYLETVGEGTVTQNNLAEHMYILKNFSTN